MQRSRLVEDARTLPSTLDLLGQKKSNQNGLAKLVLSLVDLLRQALEHQALRRVESGELTESEVEKLGLAFLQLKSKVQELSKDFGLDQSELMSTFGSLIKTGNNALDETPLVDVLNRLVDKGAYVGGQVKITVADVELVGLDLFAMLYPISNKRRMRKG